MGKSAKCVVHIDGMRCMRCVNKIKNHLCDLDGIEAVDIELKEKRGSITGIMDAAHIVKEILMLGYDASILEQEDGETDDNMVQLDESEPLEIKTDVTYGDSSAPLLNEAPRGVSLDAMNNKTSNFSITGMSCASCVNAIESNLKEISGVYSISVNILEHKGKVVYDPSRVNASQLTQCINDLGYHAEVLDDEVIFVFENFLTETSSVEVDRILQGIQGIQSYEMNMITHSVKVEYETESIGIRTIKTILADHGFITTVKKLEFVSKEDELRELEIQDYKKKITLGVIFGLPSYIIMIFMFIPAMHQYIMYKVPPGIAIQDIILFITATPIQFVIGKRFYTGAWKALKHKTSNMNTLIAVGTSAAYFYSLFAVIYSLIEPTFNSETFFDTSAMLIPIIFIGKYMELIAKGKTSEAIKKLIELQPPTALLTHTQPGENRSDEEYIPNIGCVVKVEEIDLLLVQRFDILKVLPNSKIPVDGEVVYGSSNVDESMITGESMPVKKKIGLKVIGGTLNQHGTFYMKVERVGHQTQLSQIIKHVRDAQTEKAPIQQIADKISAYFVPVVLLTALLVFSVWYYVGASGKVTLPSTTSPFQFALLRAISVIVISCPCALGLATPTAVMVGTGVGAQNGILIKGGKHLEIAYKISAVAFDKTGTLTVGKPSITFVEMFDVKKKDGSSITEETFYRVVGAAESNSEHPLAQTIKSYMSERVQSFPKVNNFETHDGKGIECHILNFHVLIGNRKLMKDRLISIPKYVEDKMTDLEEQANTCSLVAFDDQVVGLIGLSDTIKPDAESAISTLESMGISCWMITGDNRRTAEAVARRIGIQNVVAEVVPNEKSQQIKRIQAMNKVVAMVGDGANDSIALASADIGIAIGAGTDIAIETADMVLLKNSLHDVITAIDLSKKTFKRIKLNYLWAIIYNALGIPLAAGMLYPFGISIPPVVAGLAMAFSSVSVVVSSLLLKRYKKPVFTSEFKEVNIEEFEENNYEMETIEDTSTLIKRSLITAH